MKVNELLQKIESLRADEAYKNHCVEFVTNTKKFFLKDSKAGMNTMALEITRDNYRPLTLEALISILKRASSEQEINVIQGKNQLNITDSYTTDSTLELILE